MPLPQRAIRDVDVILEHGPRWEAAQLRIGNNESRIATLEGRIASIEGQITGTDAKLNDIKLAVVGDLVAGKWQPGFREEIGKKIEHVEDKVDELKTETARSMKEFERQVTDALAKADSFIALGRWATGVLTAILVGLVTEIGNSYFGWFGAAKAAHAIVNGGH